MHGDLPPTRSGCESIRALVPWYPTRDLADGERLAVRDHIATCAACRDTLRIAETMARDLAPVAPHPAPETLVALVEAPTALPAGTHRLVHAHLAVCPTCADETNVLRRLATPGDEARLATNDGTKPSAPSGAHIRPTDLRERLLRFLTGSLLRPAPAAVYLVTTLTLGTWLMTRPTPGPESPALTSPPEAVAITGGVTLIADESRRVRDTAAVPAMPTISSAGTELLVLELTSMPAPPDPAAFYEVTLTRSGDAEPSWRGRISGNRFRESYSIGVVIAPGALSPGLYRAVVRDPDNRALCDASFLAR